MTFRLAFVILLCFMLAACENKISNENYELITNGMSRSSVEDILGPGEKQETGGTSISAAGIAGSNRSNQIIYSWRKGQAEISVTFDTNGKVINKSKSGL